MLLTCPSCETSFRIKPDALGPSGRTVRCARCHTNWFAAPEGVEWEPAIAEAAAIGAGSASLPVIPSNDPVNDTVNDTISWREPFAENEPAPPLVPNDLNSMTPVLREDAAEAEIKPARRALPPRPLPRKASRKGLGVATLAAAAALVVLAVLVTVFIAKMDLYPCDMRAVPVQRMSHDTPDMIGRSLMAFDVTVSVDLNLHAVLLL